MRPPIGPVADRVDVFVGRPRGHDDAPAEQRARGPEHVLRRRDDLVGLGEPSLADPAAREKAVARIDDAHAARRQRLQVALDRRMLEHVGVHRRSEQHRSPGRQVERGQEVVRDPVGELAYEVGGRRRDQQQPDVGRQRDVLDVGVAPRANSP